MQEDQSAAAAASASSESPASEAGPSVRDALQAAVSEAAERPAARDDNSVRAALTDSMREAREPAATERRAPAIEAPQNWVPADRELFAKQTPEAQKWLLERHKAMETDHQARTTAIVPLMDVVKQAAPYLQSIGIKPEVAFRTLLSVEYTLRHGTPEQKAAAAQKLLADYDITLPGSTAGPTETSAADPAADQSEWEEPGLTALRKDVAAVRAENDRLRQTLIGDEQNRVIAEIKSFAGQPDHAYFDDVIETMIEIAHAERVAGRMPQLDDLYRKAVRLNDSVAAKIEADKARAAQAKPALQPAPARRDPRAVAAAINGSSLRGALTAALAQHTSRS